MTDNPLLTFRVGCAHCGDILKSETNQFSNAFDFMDWARQQGWKIPLATDNKPIECPKCLTQQNKS